MDDRGVMNSDDKAFFSQFQIEGEEQVRRNIMSGIYGARGSGIAMNWLEEKSSAREERAQEDRLLSERQTQASEIANQLAERQAQMAESANRLARDANRLSRWAIGLSILGCILAVAAILYDHA